MIRFSTSMNSEILPVDETLPALRRALTTHHAVVLQAPPGAGKTTRVPLALLNEPWLEGRSILMLEPRRLAARAACAWMATLRGESPGETVGYRIRFESRISAATRIEVLTEGILTRRLQTDPELQNVGLVIFDEFHERNLHADLALALCLDSRRHLREDLKILIMSATLDGESISQLLSGAPKIVSEGRQFPVDIRYLARDPVGPLSPLIADTVRVVLAEEQGDLLVFLPGAGEIRRTQDLLQANIDSRVDVLPLYGDLPWEKQERALQPVPGRRKIVLATPIAETSLTIEGIRVVIDSGYARAPQFDPRSGLSRLTTVRISRASSEQRAGRAGRLGPGVCYRMWSEATQRGLVPHTTPEIRSVDLAPLALELAAWGARDAQALDWLDPPPEATMSQARELLTELDALDTAGSITKTGRTMARLPLHPRLSHMLYASKQFGLEELACDVAALLSERDVLAGESRRSADFALRLEALWAFRRHGRTGARSHEADGNACARANRAAQQYRQWLSLSESVDTSDTSDAGLLLALAYPDRVALARSPGDSRYRLASGRGARLPENEMNLRQPCIVAASLDAGEGEGVIFSAAALPLDQLRENLAAHLRERDVVRWDEQEAAVVAQQEESFGSLTLDARPLSNPDSEKIFAAMLVGIQRLGLDALPWSIDSRQWQARVLSLRQWQPTANWPDVSDQHLMKTLDNWLGPYLDGITRRDHLVQLDLSTILASQLDWEKSGRLEEGAPTHLTVPSGARRRLEYHPGESPALKVKLQEMFGLANTPCVAWGKIPVTLHLLSPAQRPIQVTQDLRGFWERTYPEVKKELKGRYPKHPWPDDPWNATPTARASRARR